MAFKLKNTWKYVGDDRWDWDAFIDDGGTGELKEVAYVEYVLHPTFRNPIRRVAQPQDNFRLQTNGWGVFELKAFIYKKDGQKEKLVHEIQLKYDPVQGVSS